MFEETVSEPMTVINWLSSVRNCKAFESVQISPFADICIVYPKGIDKKRLSKLIQKYLKVEINYEESNIKPSEDITVNRSE